MRISGSSIKAIVLFVAAFLLSGVIHVVFYGVDFTDCITQFYVGAVTALWALSVQKRVADKRLRRLLLIEAGFLLLYYILQIARYKLILENSPLHRWVWYCYYIPMIVVALCCFYISLNVNRISEKPLRKSWYLPIIPCVLIIIGILTNDFHRLAFRFQDSSMSDLRLEGYGLLFYVYYGTYALLFLIAFIIFLRKMPRELYKGYRLIPVVPLVLMGIFLILDFFHLSPTIHGIRIWQNGEIFGFFIIAFFESCIQLGMIPANTGYEQLFGLSDMKAAILDHDGKPVYQTAGAEYPFSADETTKINSHPIQGGRVEWAVDLFPVQQLNRELEEKNYQMETRNAYLTNENAIRKEKAELETRHHLYDRIREVLSPQLNKVEQAASEKELEKVMPFIAVMGAYIKRRSNMEILASSGQLSSEELFTAVKESLEYVKLNGVNTAVRSSGIGVYVPEVILAAYQDFEDILENCFASLRNLMVTIIAGEEKLTLRVLAQADSVSLSTADASGKVFTKTLSITQEEQDTNILLSYEVRGGAK